MINLAFKYNFQQLIFISLLSSPIIYSIYLFVTKNSQRMNKNLSLGVLNLKKNSKRVMELIDQYSNSSNIKIFIKNKEVVCKKLNKMILDGQKYLQIISDFDRTLSRCVHNGSLNLTSHGVFERDPELTEEMKEEFNKIRDYYMKIEFDPNMSNEAKIPYMLEWWTKAHELIVSTRLHRDVLESYVRKCDVGLRDGVEKFMYQLNDLNVPLLVFSAGIGNVIEEILKSKDLLLDNVRIVSNFMNFDSDGIIQSFQDEIIHSFNKSAKSIQDSEFYENICTKRTNVILIGDSFGDPHMSDGLNVQNTNILKLGFLNQDVSNVKESLAGYMNIYDIVIIQDESFSIPQLILDQIN